MEIYIQAILGLLFLVLVFLWWMGVFSSIAISESTFNGGTFMFKDFQGNIKNVGNDFTKIDKEVEAYR